VHKSRRSSREIFAFCYSTACCCGHSTTMSSLSSGDSRVCDIRRKVESTDLQKQIVSGLSSQPRSMPSLLLWDDEGQRLFNSFAQTASYYPYHKELEMLNHITDDIVGKTLDGSVLVELGCGCVLSQQERLSFVRIL
jgi:uncharacterized SAM-dependent methyltransferase